MTSKHRLDPKHQLPPMPADPFAQGVVPETYLQPAPMRPRGRARHTAPPVTLEPIPAPAPVTDPVPRIAAEAPLEWPTHPTRRDLRLAREAGREIPRGLVGTLAARKWDTGKHASGLSMAVKYGPFPAPVADLKDFRTNWMLSALLGPLGADRFHRGQHVTGTLKLLTLGGAGLWWATDQLAVAAGKVTDAGGHPMAGKRSHRLIAGGASLALIAGAGASAVAVLAPGVDDAADDLMAVVVPEHPEPVWEHLATLSGGRGAGPSKPFTVTGDGVTFDYTMKDAGFIYLLPAGTKAVPDGAEPLVSSFEASKGSITKSPAPGKYILYVQSPGAGWNVDITQRVLR